MRAGFGHPHQLAIRLPAALILLGKRDEAIEEIEQHPAQAPVMA
jgi:hypothetical protein